MRNLQTNISKAQMQGMLGNGALQDFLAFVLDSSSSYFFVKSARLDQVVPSSRNSNDGLLNCFDELYCSLEC